MSSFFLYSPYIILKIIYIKNFPYYLLFKEVWNTDVLNVLFFLHKYFLFIGKPYLKLFKGNYFQIKEDSVLMYLTLSCPLQTHLDSEEDIWGILLSSYSTKRQRLGWWNSFCTFRQQCQGSGGQPVTQRWAKQTANIAAKTLKIINHTPQ